MRGAQAVREAKSIDDLDARVATVSAQACSPAQCLPLHWWLQWLYLPVWLQWL